MGYQSGFLTENLSGLTVGSKTLDPEFDGDIKNYEVDTEDATNTVSATAANPSATVEIYLNGTLKKSGTGSASESLTWTANTDTLDIIVSNVAGSKTYTVEVTHNV